MQIDTRIYGKYYLLLAQLCCALVFSGCGGGGGDGARIEARPQTIAFTSVPTLVLGAGSVVVSATASSGLPLRYGSDTRFVCSVDSATGAVTALTTGVCTVAAYQDGDATYAPVRVTRDLLVQVNPLQNISFAAAPILDLFGMATVSAAATSGLPVTYSSQTPTICLVESDSGKVTDLSAGNCIIAADQPGSSSYPVYHAAPQVTQTLPVVVPATVTVPGAPTNVKASLGDSADTVIVTVGGVSAGGAPITSYSVLSSPAGVSGTGNASSSSITVKCPTNCSGYAFRVFASNAVGDGPTSDAVDVITVFNVVETFYEPETQPNNSIFTGSFKLNSTTRTVTELRGNLTESMTGGAATQTGVPGSYGSVPMTLVPLSNQLSVIPRTLDGVDGLLVTTFTLNSQNTFTKVFGGDGWSPSSGVQAKALYYGLFENPNQANAGNAYAMIFVNPNDPFKALTPTQINYLAYADCTPGGMMASVCMTGTTVAAYGAIGSMAGYPVSQVISK